ncbi:MAG: glycosyltransferase family 87 protein [Lachnospiraceae bacterium]
MKKLKSLLYVTDDVIRVWDYVIFFVIAAVCALVFQQDDLVHTVACSYGFSNGHFLDFYDYVGQFDIHPSYMPTIYLLFGIWNLPIRLLGIVKVPTLELGIISLMWAKILPCIIYMMNGGIVYLICRQLSMEAGRAKLCLYAVLTCPIAVYSQFIFGQYDSFMVFFVLLGVWFYLKDQDWAFVLCFGAAITVKYTALLLFIPMLLLKEKNVWKILQYCVGVSIFFAIEYLLYHNSAGFQNYVFGLGGTDGPAGYAFNTNLSIGFVLGGGMDYQVNLILVIFAVICAYAYFTKTETKLELAQWMLYLCCLSLFNIFGLCKYHPQWLILAVPFWVVSAFLNKNTKIFMIIDIIFMLFFIAFHVQMIPDNVDQAMFNNGIFKFILPNKKIGTEVMMGDLFSFLPREICLSFNTAIMLVYALFKHPKYCITDLKENVEPMIGWLRTRLIVGVSIFVLPAMVCLVAALTNPVLTYSGGVGDVEIPEISRGHMVSQIFESKGDSVDKIRLSIGASDYISEGNLQITLKAVDSDEILYYTEYDVTASCDRRLLSIDMGDTPVENGKEYKIIFVLNNYYEDCALSLLGSSQVDLVGESERAYIDEEEQEYCLRMDVYQHQ